MTVPTKAPPPWAPTPRVRMAVKTAFPVKVEQDAPIEVGRQSVQEQIEELRQTMVQQQNTGLNGQLSELTGLLRALVAGQAGGSGGPTTWGH
eukprot:3295955-Pyramimonas_sp.AAC.1